MRAFFERYASIWFGDGLRPSHFVFKFLHGSSRAGDAYVFETAIEVVFEF
jgi:hypothetical protein